MRRFAGVFGHLAGLLCVAGIVCYFTGPQLITIIAAVTSVVAGILNVLFGDQNNLASEITTYFVGAIIAVVFKLKFWGTVALVFCIVDVLLSLRGIIPLLFMLLCSPRRK